MEIPVAEFNNIFYPADVNGCGAWRGTFPINTIWSQGPDTKINVNIMQNITADTNFYKPMNSVMVQRLVDDRQRNVFDNLLKKVSDPYRFWIIYNIDDAMHYKDIVKYNRGRAAFIGEHVQENIKHMLNESDFVLVTTDYIKNYYHERYGVPLENIIAIPNYLPKWWMGAFYNKERSVASFNRSKAKPRVGVISSLSHYNLDNIFEDETGSVIRKKVGKDKKPILDNNGKEVWINERDEVVDIGRCTRVSDDLDLILPAIEETVDDVQWVFFGYTPPKLNALIAAKKIECHPGIPIIDYPVYLNKLRLNMIVAPITDGVFNRCKSNIKYLESAAMGVPLFASNIPPYSLCMPSSQLFNDAKDLKEKILKLKFSSAGLYEKIIESQWRFLNSPHKECGISSPNWWMEDNIGVWKRLFSMRKKPVVVSISRARDLVIMQTPGDANNPFYADAENGLMLTL